jgi:hypothetical protein
LLIIISNIFYNTSYFSNRYDLSSPGPGGKMSKQNGREEEMVKKKNTDITQHKAKSCKRRVLR